MTRRHSRWFGLVVLLSLALVACASRAPSSLDAAGTRLWRANEAVVAITLVQDAAIALNAIERCEPTCIPLLSTANTRIVVEAVRAALLTIRAVPEGWKPTSLTALMQIRLGLDAAGKEKIGAYVQVAETVIASIR